MNLTDSQNRAVQSIIDVYHLPLESRVKNIQFKAPTGSGKTFMASNIISSIFKDDIAKYSHINTIIVIATVSTSELPKQFKDKFEQYKPYLEFKDFNILHYESPSKDKARKSDQDYKFDDTPGNVIIFGTSSFGKSTLFSQQQVLEKFLNNIEAKNLNLVYIRDEAHIGVNSNEAVKFTKESKEKEFTSLDAKIRNRANFIIDMTATPKYGKDKKVIQILESELAEDNDDKFLLKMNHKDFKEGDDFINLTSMELLEKVVSKFKNVKAEYLEANKKYNQNIRPALLIQVKDKPNKNTDPQGLSDYNNLITNITNYLNDNGLSYLKYIDDKSSNIESTIKGEISLKDAAKEDSLIDVVIFKVGPSVGWDIPRACMLVQFREVSSESLNTQTIGRIRRNPDKQLRNISTYQKYYLYSNFKNQKTDLIYYQLNPKYEGLENFHTFARGYINRNINKPIFKVSIFRQGIKEIFSSDEFVKLINTLSKMKILSFNYSNLFSANTSASLTEKIDNVISLRIWNSRFINKNKKFFNWVLNEEINLISEELNVSRDLVYFSFLKEILFLKRLKRFYLDALEKGISVKDYLVKNDGELPLFYPVYIRENQIKSNIEAIENYGYINTAFENNVRNQMKFEINLFNKIKPNDTIIKEYIIQYFDSKPEGKFAIELFKGPKITEILNSKKVLFYSKLPVLNSKVYFEYINVNSHTKDIHKAFIDFIIRFQNGHQILIEVKSDAADYDKIKTDAIKNAMKIYTKTNEKLHFFLFAYDSNNSSDLFKLYRYDNNGEEKWDNNLNALYELIVKLHDL
ncbi:type III restriction enzyme [Mycoplasma testudineum]|uniref:Type III restriction enzyme n=1 Tax=Mycoplasma testudineum TaxID=244584 RepID=A0A4R6IJG0_9MOLU|nr:DEAD/DEAH box helicase family protein [Mycoplasma testudineum]OYD26457.1 hypothetical protein CG473_03905 [Mycoplasma testudineum]TDO22159.1 type III restriction enzyme [Mycoplasma testudineum]